MFYVNDTTDNRETRISEFLTETDCAIAVLLAAAHFEWSISRAILALGTRPNRELRVILARCFGLDRYRDLWAQEVASQGKIGRLPVVIPNWPTFRESFNLRHTLIHGRMTCSLSYAKPKVASILQASRNVHDVCQENGINLYQRLPVRRIKGG